MFGFIAIQNSFNSSEVAMDRDNQDMLNANAASKSAENRSEELGSPSEANQSELADVKEESEADPTTPEAKQTPSQGPNAEADDLSGSKDGYADRDKTKNEDRRPDKRQQPGADRNLKESEPAEAQKVAEEKLDQKERKVADQPRVARAERADQPLSMSPAPPPPKIIASKPAAGGRNRTEANVGAAKKKKVARNRGAADSVSSVSKGRVASRVGNPTRRVSGKTFTLKDRVWYDSQYRGQKTTNIKRGSEEFKKAPSIVRTVAGRLKGTVVLVVNKKAYRVD